MDNVSYLGNRRIIPGTQKILEKLGFEIQALLRATYRRLKAKTEPPAFCYRAINNSDRMCDYYFLRICEKRYLPTVHTSVTVLLFEAGFSLVILAAWSGK